jgi:hypothetical protein
VTVTISFQKALNDRLGRYSTKPLPRRFTWRALLVVGAFTMSTGVLIPSVSEAADLSVPGASGHAPGAVASSGMNQIPYLSHFATVTNVSSTVPGNGDLNPYGIANVLQSTGALVRGDTLVSNFNAASNLQGTGTTIVQISPSGEESLFAQLTGPLPGKCPGGVGLTTALTVLSDGFVVVGSLPVTDAGKGTAEAGCLIVLNSVGAPVETWSGSNINGPWDMTAVQVPGFAELFVTNVLNGTVAAGGAAVNRGTVVRLDVVDPPGHNPPQLLGSQVVGSGFSEELNSSALVLGPTGVALGHDGTLYVADTVNNRLASLPSAWLRSTPVPHGGLTLTSGGSLNSPLGMALAPNGDVITVNAGDGNAVETTPSGQQVATVQIDPAGAGGDLFGLTISPNKRGVLFVDDGDNTLKLFH